MMTIDYNRLIELISMVVTGQVREAIDGNVKVYRVKYGVRVMISGV